MLARTIFIFKIWLDQSLIGYSLLLLLYSEARCGYNTKIPQITIISCYTIIRFFRVLHKCYCDKMMKRARARESVRKSGSCWGGWDTFEKQPQFSLQSTKHHHVITSWKRRKFIYSITTNSTTNSITISTRTNTKRVNS